MLEKTHVRLPNNTGEGWRFGTLQMLTQISKVKKLLITYLFAKRFYYVHYFYSFFQSKFCMWSLLLLRRSWSKSVRKRKTCFFFTSCIYESNLTGSWNPKEFIQHNFERVLKMLQIAKLCSYKGWINFKCSVPQTNYQKYFVFPKY